MNMMPNNGMGMMANLGAGMLPNAVPPGLLDAIGNPGPALQNIGLTPNALRNPDAAIQGLMNSGKLTQDQYNSMYQAVQNFKNDPQVQQMMSKMIGR